jgi:hypothetical protein
MKKLLIVLTTSGLTAALCAGLFIPYNVAKEPALVLPTAYNQALTALGAETNKFHCVGASIETSLSPDGEWRFTFYSTNLTPKWVTVEFNGKIHVQSTLKR